MGPQSKQQGVDLLICSLRFGEESRRMAVKAASAPRKKAVRITGAAASLDPRLAQMMYGSIGTAFAGCDITILGGGTRMKDRINPALYRHGITEVIPLIGKASPESRTIGVVPRQTKLILSKRYGLVVSDTPENDFVTVVHPDLDTCLLLQYSADKGLDDWNAEWKLSLDYISALRQDGGHTSAHVVYGGGKTTERELTHVAKLRSGNEPWRVVIVSDSGGVASQYAQDRAFCDMYSHNVITCTAEDLSRVMQDLGFTD